VGPDYIDPGYHALASGRPGRNLDPWMVGEERIADLFLHGAGSPVPADVAVVEGVMGLFDGVAGPRDFGSTAHVARLLQAPVVLVVDAAAMSRSIAALVHGFATFDPSVRLAGVILNRVGSDRHEELLLDALAETGLPVLGAVRRHSELRTPSRHLGLVPAAERQQEARDTVAALARVVADSIDLEAVMNLARSAPALPSSDPENAPSAPPAGIRPVVAVAGGSAFTFGYTETVELLVAAGAEVRQFDPTGDERLPERTAGIVIGGGFPEVYADSLARNVDLQADIRRAVDAGSPVVAECAGLLYLAQSLDGAPMCAVLPTQAHMTATLTIGYRDAVALTDSVIAAAGTRVRGHEFHRTACTPSVGASPAWQWKAGTPEGFVTGSVHASYLHTHWAGNPGMAPRFVAACSQAAARA
jgi:cobyrinic acid a,c-diamide synthase